MIQRLIRKDKQLRKQYNRLEIWNKLNKSLKKSLFLYKIQKKHSSQRKKNI